jgi:rhodanese-related sulfurtransferase
MTEGRARMTVNELLYTARSRLQRLDPLSARDAVAAGAALIDIRSERQRERDGVIPDAVFVPRNVLEWRLDPASGHADPALGRDFNRHVILICDEGYQSSLAAATLQQLGFHRATDVDGGFQAWRAAGLPVASYIASDRQASPAPSAVDESGQMADNQFERN